MADAGNGTWDPESLLTNITVELVAALVVVFLAAFYRKVLAGLLRSIWRFIWSYLETPVAKAIRFWPEVVAGVVQISAVLILVGLLFFYGVEPSTFWLTTVVTGCLASYVGIQEFRFARKSSYAEITAALHMVVHNLRDHAERVPTMDEGEFADTVRGAMDLLARAFSIVTRTNCRVSVKVITSKESRAVIASLPPDDRILRLLVKTLVRDSGSPSTARDSFAERLYDNEDFVLVYRDATQRWFMENDLIRRTKDKGYYNSHLPDDFDSSKDDWPLPYRSAAVWPIRKVGTADDHPGHHILGFLCVDSPSRRVFAPRYDFHVGALVADALYVFMRPRFDRAANS